MSVTSMLPVVRTAGPADEVEVYRLLLLSHAENGLFPHDNNRVQYFVKRFLFSRYLPDEDMGPRGIFGVIGPVGKLEGVCMMGLGMFWYTLQRHLEEYLVFVDPDFRKGNHARALLEWAKRQAEKTGLPMLTGILSNTRTEAKCRLYRRALPKVGEYFIWPSDFYSDQLTGRPATARRLVAGSSAA